MRVRHIVFVSLLAAGAASAASGRVAVVGKTVVDFGEYPAGESREAVFRIRNIGEGSLSIARVRKGCGCATATFGKPRLAPGEETDIRIRVHPYSIFGPYRKTAYVDTDAPRTPHTRLVYGGTARPLIAVSPRHFVYAGRLPLHREISHEFTLAPTRDGVVFGQPAVRAALPVKTSLQTRKGTTNTFLFSIALTPTNSGPLQVAVDLPVVSPTNHPTIKLGLAGSLGREMVALPARLLLSAAATPLQRCVRLRLIGPTHQELDTALVRVAAFRGVSHKLVAGQAGNTADLALSFAPGFVNSLRRNGEKELLIRYQDAVPARIRLAPQGRQPAAPRPFHPGGGSRRSGRRSPTPPSFCLR